MEENEKRIKELEQEFKLQEEKHGKDMLKAAYLVIFASLVFFLGIAIICELYVPEPDLTIIMVVSTIVFVFVVLLGFRFEVDAGFYECKNCKHKFKAKYGSALVAMHLCTTRFLKCPKCHKRTWARKKMSK